MGRSKKSDSVRNLVKLGSGSSSDSWSSSMRALAYEIQAKAEHLVQKKENSGTNHQLAKLPILSICILQMESKKQYKHLNADLVV